ncbi:UNKNOWN [Stylonychia lemnae]|uniref:Cyclic nucleotide-binding domain-containing protein n=1 Tax=Stylonychia lemnae TaxID=5949 RepID=A0A077ZPW6_STYLE|nr:UNKNOWN [Stylonychia lemnae]|eukprot:CDW71420.1 UNKNOWN [Stylonychia lemnae]
MNKQSQIKATIDIFNDNSLPNLKQSQLSKTQSQGNFNVSKLSTQLNTKDIFTRGNRNHIKGGNNFSMKNTMSKVTNDTTMPEYSNEFSSAVDNLPSIDNGRIQIEQSGESIIQNPTRETAVPDVNVDIQNTSQFMNVDKRSIIQRGSIMSQINKQSSTNLIVENDRANPKKKVRMSVVIDQQMQFNNQLSKIQSQKSLMQQDGSVRILGDHKSKTIRNLEIDKQSKQSSQIVSPLSRKYNVRHQSMQGELKSQEESDNSSIAEEGEQDGKNKKTFKHMTTIKAKKSISALDQMAAIFSKPLDEREKADKDKIVQFLRNCVPFLANIQLPLLYLLSDKLEPLTLKQGDIIMRKGDEADCMYIIYAGEVGIFFDVDCATPMFSSCKPNQVFGEKALENNNRRGASIKVLIDCKLLRLKKLFYQSIVQDVIAMQKIQALEFLKTIDILKGWSLIKLQNLNKELTEKNYAPGNIVYQQGDESSVFYIIKKGSVVVETVIDIDEYNRYPIDIKTWEIVKKTKRFRYKIQELGKASIFGHNELILKVPRQTTIKALEETTILYLNKEVFENQNVIEEQDMKLIKGQVSPIDVEKIALAVLSIKNNAKQRTDAILNATQLNLPIDTTRDFGMLNRHKSQIFRLKAWHEKIRTVMERNNSLSKTSQAPRKNQDDLLDDSDDENQNYLNEELKKVKILRITQKKMRVSGNEYIKQQDVLNTELKHRVRLATNILASEY